DNDSIDHIIPVSRCPDRAHDVTNLEWVTRTVNFMKRNMIPDEFLAAVKKINDFRETHTAN
ncbi:MAG: hypothetical protein V3V74_01365, partial [Nitrosomonadaceae bacterium]